MGVAGSKGGHYSWLHGTRCVRASSVCEARRAQGAGGGFEMGASCFAKNKHKSRERGETKIDALVTCVHRCVVSLRV